MQTLSAKLSVDWAAAIKELDEKGFASVSRALPDHICDEFVANYEQSGRYRKTVVMERHRFGLGEYKYFDYPLPDLLQSIRETIYPKLAPVANRWMGLLRLEARFPAKLSELETLCREHGQTKATPLILKYGPGGFNTLHQDLYGGVYFPMQLAFFLNEPGEDYAGGEFVLTEQVPRAVKGHCPDAEEGRHGHFHDELPSGKRHSRILSCSNAAWSERDTLRREAHVGSNISRRGQLRQRAYGGQCLRGFAAAFSTFCFSLNFTIRRIRS